MPFRPKRPSVFKKISAALTAAVFACTTAADPVARAASWDPPSPSRISYKQEADPQTAEAKAILSGVAWPRESIHPLLGSFRLSSQVGTVIDTGLSAAAAHEPEKIRPLTIYHVQDAHGVYEAQKNVSKILEGLTQAVWEAEALKKNRTSRPSPLLVLQEGGTGPVPVDWLAAFPSAETKRQVARAHLRQGRLTGEEYQALLESPGALRLVGLEEPALYQRNLQARHGTVEARLQAAKHIAGLRSRLAAVKEKAYPAALRELDGNIRAFSDKNLPYVDYLKELSRLSPRGVGAAEFPNVHRVLRLAEMESRMDLAALRDERVRLVEKMAGQMSLDALKELAAQAGEMREGRVNPRVFFEGLVSVADLLGRRGAAVPSTHMRRYVAYLKLREEVRHDRLPAETEQLENRLLEAFSSNDRVWRLIQLDRRLEKEARLWDLKTTPERFAAYRQEGPLDWIETERYLLSQEKRYGLPSRPLSEPSHLAVWLDRLPDVLQYYELALERDAAMARRALAEMSRAGATRAVLIAGGFHTPGLTRLLRQANVNYVVIQPRFNPSAPAPAEDGALQIGHRFDPRAADGLREPNQLADPAFRQRLGMDMVAVEIADILSATAEERARRIPQLQSVLSHWGRDNALPLSLEAALYRETDQERQVLIRGRNNGEPVVLLYDLQRNTVTTVVGKDQVQRAAIPDGQAQDLRDRLDGLPLTGKIGWRDGMGWVRAVLFSEDALTLDDFIAEARDFLRAYEEGLTPASRRGRRIALRLLPLRKPALPAVRQAPPGGRHRSPPGKIWTVDELLEEFGADDLPPLVTGGAGFVGSHLTDRLASEGGQAVVLFRSGDPESTARLEAAKDNPDVFLVEVGDFLAPRSLARFERLVSKSPVVYHVAAQADARVETPEQAAETYLTNVFFTGLLVRFTERHGKRLVYGSSAHAYTLYPGGFEGPVTERTALPLSPRAREFRDRAEQAFREYVERYAAGEAGQTPEEFVYAFLEETGVMDMLRRAQEITAQARDANVTDANEIANRVAQEVPPDLWQGLYSLSKIIPEAFVLALPAGHGIALRFTNAYGPRGRPGEVYNLFIDRIAADKPVHASDHSRNFIHIEDSIAALEAAGRLLQSPDYRDDENHLVLVGSDEGAVSMKALLDTVLDLFIEEDPAQADKYRRIKAEAPVRPSRPLLQIPEMDFDKARDLLPGWRARTPLKEGLRPMVREALRRNGRGASTENPGADVPPGEAPASDPSRRKDFLAAAAAALLTVVLPVAVHAAADTLDVGAVALEVGLIWAVFGVVVGLMALWTAARRSAAEAAAPPEEPPAPPVGTGLPSEVEKVLFPGGLFVTPLFPQKSGHSLVVDGRGATIDREGNIALDAAVAVALFQQMEALGRSASDGKPMHLDILVNLPDDAQPDAFLAFQQILNNARAYYPEAAIEALQERVSFGLVNVTITDPKGRVAELLREKQEQNLDMRVVVDPAHLPFWSEVLKTQEGLFLVVARRAAADLARVEVDIILSGAEAQFLIQMAETHKELEDILRAARDAQGRLHFQAVTVPQPVQQLEEDQKAIVLFNSQA